ncbi:hypothetical protein [Bacillus cereus]|uniref:Uncharacterized protein n=1 Tax=Bacillus cereus TaxID=1396 RepID=A0A2B1KNN2_BACCE|nr:hypothetical protein [Bacillus cereus]PFN25108.1 hypothetical protein COJ50_13630 [Bacillus cereus]
MTKELNKKSLDLLLERFHDVSENTKELDVVVSNFTDVIDHFSETLIDLDTKFSIQEIGELSSEAIKKLKDIRTYSQLQILGLLQEAIKKEVTDHIKEIQVGVQTAATKQNARDRKIEGVLQQIQSKLKTAEENKNETPKQEEMMLLLQRIEQQTRMPYAAPAVNNEEIEKLKKLVSRLSSKVRSMEEQYEDKLLMLENEIEVLQMRLNQEHVGVAIDITDEDLPF